MKKHLVRRVKWKKLLLYVACGYIVVCLIGGCFDIYKLKVQEAQLEAKIEQAMQEQALWEERVEEMSSQEAMERIARERLGMVMPGEVVLKKVEIEAQP